MQTSLDQIFALSLGHKWLKLGCRERVDEPCLRDNQQQYLGSGQCAKFIGLSMVKDVSFASYYQAD